VGRAADRYRPPYARPACRYRLRRRAAYYSLRIRNRTARLVCRAAGVHGVALTESWDARLFQLAEIVLNTARRCARRRGRGRA
jgi:hypothetical protein